MTAPIESDLVVVANRLPVHRAGAGDPWETSPGGLVSALLPMLRSHGGIRKRTVYDWARDFVGAVDQDVPVAAAGGLPR